MEHVPLRAYEADMDKYDDEMRERCAQIPLTWVEQSAKDKALCESDYHPDAPTPDAVMEIVRLSERYGQTSPDSDG